MAFKASFKFSDSREFDVLRWDVKFNRDVDPKGRPASDIYGGKIYVEVESTPDTIVLDKMFKQYQPVNGSIVFKKADEDAKMKELVFENGYVVEIRGGTECGQPLSDDNQVRHFRTDCEDGRGYICTGLAGKQLTVVF